MGQFGVGLLGRDYDPVKHIAGVLANTQPVRENFARHADCYAAKIAAETILAEPPMPADLSDEAIVRRCALCGISVRPSEASLVRAAFLREYGQQTFEIEAA